MDGDAFEVGEVGFDFCSFVVVDAAGEVFDVDEVGEVGVVEAQECEGAGEDGVAAFGVGEDLEGDVGEFEEFADVVELGAHDVGAADGAA